MSKRLDGIEAELKAVQSALGSGKLSAHEARSFQKRLGALLSEFERLIQQVDPIDLPVAVFDPSEPKVIGRSISLALVAQQRLPLSDLKQSYGSGVYAIYYRGPFPLYGPIAGTETPIYVGQASPSSRAAKTPRQQGPKVTGRLAEHAGNIVRANNLDIRDFDYRHLVVQTGWETAAEDYLIHLFEPVWNSETRLVYGLGKHGDSAGTRANKRSPWDTLHPGRQWAAASKDDAKSVELISSQLTAHFEATPPFESLQQVLDEFVAELRQT